MCWVCFLVVGRSQGVRSSQCCGASGPGLGQGYRRLLDSLVCYPALYNDLILKGLSTVQDPSPSPTPLPPQNNMQERGKNNNKQQKNNAWEFLLNLPDSDCISSSAVSSVLVTETIPNSRVPTHQGLRQLWFLPCVWGDVLSGHLLCGVLCMCGGGCAHRDAEWKTHRKVTDRWLLTLSDLLASSKLRLFLHIIRFIIQAYG